MSHDKNLLQSTTVSPEPSHVPVSNTKDVADDTKRSKGKKKNSSGPDLKTGVVKGSLHKVKLKKMRQQSRKPLLVKEDDANLRLTTDLPRFNWLQMKIKQSNNSQGNAVTTTSSSRTDRGQKTPCSTTDTSVTVKDSSVAVKPISAPAAKEASQELCSNRWPLKKRIVRSQGDRTKNCTPNRSSVLQCRSSQRLEETVEHHPIIIEIKLPAPELIQGPRSSAVVVAPGNGHQEEPLDLSKPSDDDCVHKPDPVTLSPRQQHTTVIRNHTSNYPPTQVPKIHAAAVLPYCDPVKNVIKRNYTTESRIADPEHVVKQQPFRVVRPIPTRPNLANAFSYHLDYWFYFNNCRTCGRRAGFRCSRCRRSAYCSESCQRLDWPNHFAICPVPSA